jgi:hypothetical protein
VKARRTWRGAVVVSMTAKEYAQHIVNAYMLGYEHRDREPTPPRPVIEPKGRFRVRP